MNEYKYEYDIYFAFTMPYDQILKIIQLSTFEMGHDDYHDDEIDGVIYVLRWNGEKLPWYTESHRHAVSIALGCQLGARKMFEMRYENNE